MSECLNKIVCEVKGQHLDEEMRNSFEQIRDHRNALLSGSRIYLSVVAGMATYIAFIHSAVTAEGAKIAPDWGYVFFGALGVLMVCLVILVAWMLMDYAGKSICSGTILHKHVSQMRYLKSLSVGREFTQHSVLALGSSQARVKRQGYLPALFGTVNLVLCGMNYYFCSLWLDPVPAWAATLILIASPLVFYPTVVEDYFERIKIGSLVDSEYREEEIREWHRSSKREYRQREKYKRARTAMWWFYGGLHILAVAAIAVWYGAPATWGDFPRGFLGGAAVLCFTLSVIRTIMAVHRIKHVKRILKTTRRKRQRSRKPKTREGRALCLSSRWRQMSKRKSRATRVTPVIR